jgi:hypothetical protein
MSSGQVRRRVEDAAESVPSSDVEVVKSVRFGRLGEWAQGCRSAERAVGPVLVIEGLVLAERVQKMGLVHDEGSVEEFGSARMQQHSMIAFILSTWIPVFTMAMPSLRKTVSKAAVYRLSRSRTRYFTARPGGP